MNRASPKSDNIALMTSGKFMKALGASSVDRSNAIRLLEASVMASLVMSVRTPWIKSIVQVSFYRAP